MKAKDSTEFCPDLFFKCFSNSGSQIFDADNDFAMIQVSIQSWLMIFLLETC